MKAWTIPSLAASLALGLASLSTAQQVTFTDSGEQIQFDEVHNATNIVGTWSSGSRHVMTGPEFANPSNLSLNYPKSAGVSYSFTDDGWYEISRYRYDANGKDPNCITGHIFWVHGQYQMLSNGSLLMHPNGDGFQHILNRCEANSLQILDYNETEIYNFWRIYTDPRDGFKLHLFGFDNGTVAPQFQVSTTPQMLPKARLRTPPTQVLGKRDGAGLLSWWRS
ncbi:Reversal of tor2 lethality [Stygiomarasmius scandens]|uniref:Protein ROT1 n=1 Tax=Marasmiellus scandens TaxID=2682957 RepID=A0ABR1JSJ6_9AGAR